jgi:hypothetical protein
MAQMLPADDAEFKLTQSFALFVGILCWCVQRIRSDLGPADPLQVAMCKLKENLTIEPFTRFVCLPERCISPNTEIALDECGDLVFNFIAIVDAGGPQDAFGTLVALRNSAAHGDARQIKPINSNQVLVGFHISCSGRRANSSERWEASVALDRHGLSAIARSIADRFCQQIDTTYPGTVCEGQFIREDAR